MPANHVRLHKAGIDTLSIWATARKDVTPVSLLRSLAKAAAGSPWVLAPVNQDLIAIIHLIFIYVL